MKKTTIIIFSEVLIILAFFLAIILKIQQPTEPSTITTPSPTTISTVPSVRPTPSVLTPNPTYTIEPTSSQRVPSVSEVPPTDNYFAEIIISTEKKIKTFQVMPDVEEQTLKHNIGWLPSSSYPGEDGTCVLMGHRDTDFQILQYCSIGDIIIVNFNGVEFQYTVTKSSIIENNNLLKFESSNNSTLILVTCYPFHYSGHASQKYLIYCTKK